MAFLKKQEHRNPGIDSIFETVQVIAVEGQGSRKVEGTRQVAKWIKVIIKQQLHEKGDADRRKKEEENLGFTVSEAE